MIGDQSMKKTLGLVLLASLGQVYAWDGYIEITNSTGGWIYIDSDGGGRSCAKSASCTLRVDKGTNDFTSNKNLRPGGKAKFHAVLPGDNNIIGMNIYRCTKYSKSNDDCTRGAQLTHLESSSGKKFQTGDDSDPYRHKEDVYASMSCTGPLHFGGDYYPGLRWKAVKGGGNCTDIEVDLLPPNFNSISDINVSKLDSAVIDSSNSQVYTTQNGDYILKNGHAILSTPDPKTGKVYELIMQKDRNLVLYSCKSLAFGQPPTVTSGGCVYGNPVWSSGTSKRSGGDSYYAKLQQTDGNFVVKDDAHSPEYATNKYSSDYKNNATLRLQSDGNLVIAKASDNSLIWASGTNGK